MTAAKAEAEVPCCAQCKEPMDVRATGRPKKFCSDNCRKIDHRLATAARQARASLPRLRRYLDDALTETQHAINRLHISGLSEEETGGLKPERASDISYAVDRALEKLRYAARDRRDALATAARHSAGAAVEDEDDD